MTAQTRAAFQSENDSIITSLGGGEVSGTDVHDRFENLSDSTLFYGEDIGGVGSAITASVTGALVKATHSGCVLRTSGNVTVPHASGSKGFYATLVAGGAHTVTFNSTTSAAMASGDMMSILVLDDADGTPTIKAALIASADQVAFS